MAGNSWDISAFTSYLPLLPISGPRLAQPFSPVYGLWFHVFLARQQQPRLHRASAFLHQFTNSAQKSPLKSDRGIKKTPLGAPPHTVILVPGKPWINQLPGCIFPQDLCLGNEGNGAASREERDLRGSWTNAASRGICLRQAPVLGCARIRSHSVDKRPSLPRRTLQSRGGSQAPTSSPRFLPPASPPTAPLPLSLFSGSWTHFLAWMGVGTGCLLHAEPCHGLVPSCHRPPSPAQGGCSSPSPSQPFPGIYIGSIRV